MNHHESPPTAPGEVQAGKRIDRKRTREHIDRILKAYWSSLVAQSEPLAAELLDRALEKLALQRAAETVP